MNFQSKSALISFHHFVEKMRKRQEKLEPRKDFVPSGNISLDPAISCQTLVFPRFLRIYSINFKGEKNGKRKRKEGKLLTSLKILKGKKEKEAERKGKKREDGEVREKRRRKRGRKGKSGADRRSD